MGINQNPYDINRARLSEHPDQHSAEWTSLCKPYTPPCPQCDSKDTRIAALEAALAKAEEALSAAPCRWLSEENRRNCEKFGRCRRCAALAAIREARHVD